MSLPDLIIHCDWGNQPHKRWMAAARRQGQTYALSGPMLAPLLPAYLFKQDSQSVLIGFDVPFGLPLAYAQKIHCPDFSTFLRWLERPEWATFFEPADDPADISLRRPFYPARPGGTQRQHLLDGLRVSHIDDLRRKCDLATADRGAAAPLFWTLGAQQVGKAALTAWREALLPALRNPQLDIGLWPFAGKLFDLLATHQIVVAEAYPAEFYRHLQIKFPRRSGQKSGKRVQAERQANAPQLLNWINTNGILADSYLIELIKQGFGPGAAGEDPFDAVVGLLGMLNVVLGHQPPGEPADDQIRVVEGWILGQQAPDHRQQTTDFRRDTLQ
ncbi:MAG: hypothetical protein QNJ45_09870 [Ardenticatenaceae bacterium]|nr:hypothetical protein [Ardenticatenaceae bacterium]